MMKGDEESVGRVKKERQRGGGDVRCRGKGEEGAEET